MIKPIFAFLLLLTCAAASAQVIPTEAPATPPPVVKIKKSKNSQNAAKSVVKIIPDADCTIYIDGEKKGEVTNGNVLRVSLAKGAYAIKAVGTNPADVVNQDYTVETTGAEVLLRISLQNIIDARLAKEKEDDQKKEEQIKENERRKVQMVYVAGGSFNMGSNDDLDYAAKPVHQVTLSSFYIAKIPVTQAQWRAVMGTNPSSHQNCDDCPVENVSWDDANEYCRKLSSQTGKNYRLPTEAEYEYAAKGGNKSQGYTYSGSNNLADVAWYSDNSGGQTDPVGQKQPNELGIYDMSGNVWEWCGDWFDQNYYGSSPGANPAGPATGSLRVIRGGSWIIAAQYCRVAYRTYYAPGYRFSDLGFRPVLVP